MPDREGKTGLLDLGRLFLPHLWPAESARLRLYVALAAACLVAAKLVNIAVPFFLKAVVDAGQPARPGRDPARRADRLRGRPPRVRRLRRAAGRRVRQGRPARRPTAWRCAVYEHLFQLSLAYHLQRRTGELSRAIERGVKSMSFLLQTPRCSAWGRRCSSSSW